MGLDTLDETRPRDIDPVSMGDDEIRLTRAATKQSFGLEHYLSGEHRFITGTISARPPAGKPGRLFINTSNSTIEYDNGVVWNPTGAGFLAPKSVKGSMIDDNQITTNHILNGTILGQDLANGTILIDKMGIGAATRISYLWNSATLDIQQAGPSEVVYLDKTFQTHGGTCWVSALISGALGGFASTLLCKSWLRLDATGAGLGFPIASMSALSGDANTQNQATFVMFVPVAFAGGPQAVNHRLQISVDIPTNARFNKTYVALTVLELA